MIEIKLANVLAVAALAALGALSGCLGTAESEAPPIDAPELETQWLCSPACPAGSSCTAPGCCTVWDEAWADCDAQATADATVVVNAGTAVYYRDASTYGDAACPNKFVVDVVPGTANWEEITLSRAIAGVTTPCACKNYEGYLKLIGEYTDYHCVGEGCSVCGQDGCGGYEPFVADALEREFTEPAYWDSAVSQCRVSVHVARQADVALPGPSDRWTGPVEVHAEIRQLTVKSNVKKPVTVRVVTED